MEQHVLPRAPVRHWICSLPWALRALLGYDRVLAALVVSAFAHELHRSLCKRAKAIVDLPSVADAHTGAIAALQRTDSALRLNVHFHVLALDGVYVRDATVTLLSSTLFRAHACRSRRHRPPQGTAHREYPPSTRPLPRPGDARLARRYAHTPLRQGNCPLCQGSLPPLDEL